MSMSGATRVILSNPGEKFGLIKVDVATATAGNQSITFTGFKSGGGTATRVVTVNGDDGVEFESISLDPNQFGNLAALSWSANGSSQVLVDNLAIGSATIPRADPLDTIPQLILPTQYGQIVFDTDTNTINDASSGQSGNPNFTIESLPTITRFIFDGDLIIPADSTVYVVGTKGLSLFATNDVSIGNDVFFDATAYGSVPGPGGGAGGSGGFNGDAGSRGAGGARGSGGAGGAQGDVDWKVNRGKPGGDGTSGSRGESGSPGTNGSSGTAGELGINNTATAYGSAGTGGSRGYGGSFNYGGARGFGGGGGSVSAGGFGGNGGNGSSGSSGGTATSGGSAANGATGMRGANFPIDPTAISGGSGGGGGGGGGGGLGGVSDVAVSTDDGFIYVTAADDNAITVFQREGDALKLFQTVVNGIDGVRGILGASSLAVTPDDKYVLVSGQVNNSLAVFQVDSRPETAGQLLFVQVLRNNVGGTAGLRGPSSVSISSDGKRAYVGAIGQAHLPGGVVAFDIDSNQPVPQSIRTTFDDIESLSINTAGGNDTLTVRNAPDPEVASVTLRTGHALDAGGTFIPLATDGDDVAVLQDFDTSTTVWMGGGNDEVQVRSTSSDASLEIHGGAGQDDINVQRLGSNVNFNTYGGTGNDTFRVAGKSIASQVNLFGDSPVQADGLPDVPPGDRLIFDPENPNPAVANFTLSNPLTPDGFAQTNGAPRVEYQSIEDVRVIAAPLIVFGIPDKRNFVSTIQVDSSFDISDLDVGFDITHTCVGDIQIKLTSPAGTSVLLLASNSYHSGANFVNTILDDDAAIRIRNGSAPFTGHFRPDQLLSTFDGQDAEGTWTLEVTDVYTNNVGVLNDWSLWFTDSAGSHVSVRSPSEGQPLWLKANVRPLGSTNQLLGPVAWDIDGDGEFGEVTGDTLNLSWEQLVDFGISDDGVYQIGARATNEDGFTSEEFTTVTIGNTAPTGTLSGHSTSIVGDVYQLGFTATDPGDDHISQWRIDWGDGSLAEIFGSGTIAATHAYMRPGNFDIAVSPVDEDSAPNAYPPVVKHLKVELTVGLVDIGGPYAVRQGDSLTLDATAVGDALGAQWLIAGHGFLSMQTFHAEVTWAELIALGIDKAGSYQLYAVFDYGTPKVVAGTILEVLNVSPTADVSNSGPVNEGDSATVMISNIFDPSPQELLGLSYSYDFDNDGDFEVDSSNSPTTVVPAAFLPDDGVYTVRVAVEDSPGNQVEFFTDIFVNNTQPTLTLSGPATAIEGSPYPLGLSVSDPGADTLTNWIIDWGDGTIEAVGSVNAAIHSFADDGQRTIHATAIDEDGSYTVSKTVSVINVAPQLRNIATPVARVDEHQIIQLTGVIVDPGLLDSFILDIDWGDGNQQSVSLAAGVNQFNIGHRFLDDGPSPGNGTLSDTYDIMVSVRDDDGAASQISMTSVTIDNVAPTIPLLQVQGLIVGENEPVVLVGNITDPGSLDTHYVTIAWGDGSTSAALVDQSNMTFTATHPYVNDTANDLKSFTITAMLTDDDGGSTTATTTVEIENPPTPLEIIAITVNDGDSQRSDISKIVVEFNRNANLQHLIDSGAIVNAVSIAGAAGNVVPTGFTYDQSRAALTISLAGSSSQTILQDGFFQLRLDTTVIHADGDPNNQLDDTDGTVDGIYRFDFYRLMGDYDGDKDVDIDDRNLFFAAYESSRGDLAYDAIYDLNGNGMVDRDDYRIWRGQYRKHL